MKPEIAQFMSSGKFMDHCLFIAERSEWLERMNKKFQLYMSEWVHTWAELTNNALLHKSDFYLTNRTN